MPSNRGPSAESKITTDLLIQLGSEEEAENRPTARAAPVRELRATAASPAGSCTPPSRASSSPSPEPTACSWPPLPRRSIGHSWRGMARRACRSRLSLRRRSSSRTRRCTRRPRPPPSRPGLRGPLPRHATRSNPGVAQPARPRRARVPCEALLLPAATHAREPCRAQPQRAPINQGWGAGGGVQPEESDGFDPRIVLYVTVRATG